MREEQWKTIEGYPEYEVSNYGNIRSWHRRSNGKVLSPASNGRDYLYIVLHRNGRAKNCYVHRLVAETFIAAIQPSMEVNHKDGCKRNNKAENLEIVTHQRNITHAIETGLTQSRGEDSSLSVLNSEAIKVIRFMAAKGTSQRLLAKLYNVNWSAIWKIIHRKNWKHV